MFTEFSQLAQLCCELQSALWGHGVGWGGRQSLPEPRSSAAVVLAEGRVFLVSKIGTQVPFLPWVWFVRAPWGKLKMSCVLVGSDFNSRLLYSSASWIEFVSVEGWRTSSPVNNEEFLPKVRTQGSVIFFPLRLPSYAIVLCSPEVIKMGLI